MIPSAKSLAHTIGGIAVYLPLFSLIDLPVGTNISPDPSLLPLLIQIIYALLHDSPDNQIAFCSLNGFKMISAILSDNRRAHMSKFVLDFLKRVFHIITEKELLVQFVDNIFLDLRIWLYQPIDLFKDVVRFLVSFAVMERYQDLKSFLTLSRILSFMHIFFWDTCTDSKICLFNEPKIDHITKKVEVERPESLTEYRAQLWKLAEAVVIQRISSDDVFMLCSFLTGVSNIEIAIEAAQFLVHVLLLKNPQIQIILTKHYSFQFILGLLLYEDEERWSQCLRLFGVFCSLESSLSDVVFYPHPPLFWVSAILMNLSNKVPSIQLTDLIFGFLFDSFDDPLNCMKPSLTFETILSATDLELKNPLMLWFAFYCISFLPEESAIVYLKALHKSLIFNFHPCTLR